ncbi:hypothetical protein XELAEV_18009599mg [Xenopus laevis]|uniref:Uncharacterized protein n=1 Tax=Xenopus laevis TaxID=8355 RepID=A0A974DSZ9_XENLA|nr:hypothetical protein XELAEV_18009599mg [Xenopus laevis]
MYMKPHGQVNAYITYLDTQVKCPLNDIFSPELGCIKASPLITCEHCTHPKQGYIPNFLLPRKASLRLNCVLTSDEVTIPPIVLPLLYDMTGGATNSPI